MSTLQVLLHKLINTMHKLMAHGAKAQPGATLPVIQVVRADEIDPEVWKDIEAQLLSAADDDLPLLSVELSAQGIPRITAHPDKDITKIIDEETLQMLDAEWHKAKTARRS